MMQDENKKEHTHEPSDRYATWTELIVAAGPLGDKTPASKIRHDEEIGPAVQLETPGVELPKITAAKIRLEDGELSAAQLMVPTLFEILQQKDIWICDTSASSYLSNSSSGTHNVKDTGSASLGHAGQALKATKTIDLS